jgi:hypothetical protein
MELDSCNSSDALLMNVFCHPGVFNGHTLAPALANLLNVDPVTQPNFGINPNVPLKNLRKRRSKLTAELTDSATELTDRTEIDLQLGNLFLEAKLTESNFQTAAPRLIERYRDLETVFDTNRLPKNILYTPQSHPPVEDYSQADPEFESDIVILPLSPSKGKPRIPHAPPQISVPAKTRTLIDGYQLIRNVLAAYAADASFCVLSDARRQDLIETWYTILSAVHSPTFATRLKLLTWQELTTTLPHDLQQFLETKYGIVAA